MRVGRSSDPEVFDAIFIERLLGEIADRTANARVIVDLGANVGYSSVFLLNAFPDAFVLAIEPDPANALICAQNLSPYGDRARVVEAAIWDAPTRLALRRGSFRDGREWATQVSPTDITADADVEAIDMQRVLRLCPEPVIDILKIDIEGAEATLFSPNARSWLTSVRNFCVEIHSVDALNRVLDVLQDFEFRYVQCGEYNVYFDVKVKENRETRIAHA